MSDKAYTAAQLTEETLTSTLLYDGRVVHLYRDTVRLPNGHETIREVIRHVGAVCVLPLLSDGSVLVERQFRYPHARVLLEIPAGKLDSKAEDRLDAAKRELYEETGYRAGKYTDLGPLYTTPAFVDEVIEMYLAEELHTEDFEACADVAAVERCIDGAVNACGSRRGGEQTCRDRAPDTVAEMDGNRADGIVDVQL